MAIEVGTKVTGKVSGITNFGAFINLGNNQTGLVHISEVSDGFIKDIHDVLSVGDDVTVKVLTVGDDGKIGLSIRKAVDKPQGEQEHHNNRQSSGRPSSNRGRSDHSEHQSNGNHREHSNNFHSRGGNGGGRFQSRQHEPKKQDFDSLMSGFLKDSEDRLTTLKRNTEGKRGGRGGRRS